MPFEGQGDGQSTLTKEVAEAQPQEEIKPEEKIAEPVMPITETLVVNEPAPVKKYSKPRKVKNNKSR